MILQASDYINHDSIKRLSLLNLIIRISFSEFQNDLKYNKFNKMFFLLLILPQLLETLLFTFEQQSSVWVNLMNLVQKLFEQKHYSLANRCSHNSFDTLTQCNVRMEHICHVIVTPMLFVLCASACVSNEETPIQFVCVCVCVCVCV